MSMKLCISHAQPLLFEERRRGAVVNSRDKGCKLFLLVLHRSLQRSTTATRPAFSQLYARGCQRSTAETQITTFCCGFVKKRLQRSTSSRAAISWLAVKRHQRRSTARRAAILRLLKEDVKDQQRKELQKEPRGSYPFSKDKENNAVGTGGLPLSPLKCLEIQTYRRQSISPFTIGDDRKDSLNLP